jgi:hypothetical protein
MKKKSLVVLIFVLLCNAVAYMAQPEAEETNADKFQDLLLRSLKSKKKGI